MRRMRVLFCVACVVLGAGIACLSMLQMMNSARAAAADKALVSESEVDVEIVQTVAEDGFQNLFARAPVAKAATKENLAQRYLELVARRSKRMTEEELSRAVDWISSQLDEEDAEAENELHQVMDELRAVIEKLEEIGQRHQGTSVSEKVRATLKVLKSVPQHGYRFQKTSPEE